MKIYWHLLKISFSQILSLRFSLIFYTLESLGYYLIVYVFYNSLFLKFYVLNGWNHSQINILISTFFLVNGIYSFIFRINIDKLPQIINDGRFDFVLINPMPTLIFYAVRRVFLPALSEVILGISLLAWSLHVSTEPLHLVNLALFVICMLNSLIVLLGINLLFVIPSFWTSSKAAFTPSFKAIKDAARYPDDLFPHSWKNIFTFIIPVALIASLPAKLLICLQQDILKILLEIIVGTSLLWGTVGYMWRLALKVYGSASS